MLVPETAVNEYHCFPRWEDEIRLAGQVLSMQTEAIAQSVAETPNDQLGLRVARANPAHVFRTLFWAQLVDHGSRREVER